MFAFNWLVFFTSISCLSKSFRINRMSQLMEKYSTLIICASELEYKTNFKQFLLLLDEQNL